MALALQARTESVEKCFVIANCCHHTELAQRKQFELKETKMAFQQIDWLLHSEIVVQLVPTKKAVDVSQIETNRKERLSTSETHR